MGDAIREAPYGLWQSPLTGDVLAGQHLSLTNTYVDKQTGAVYWSEGRPSENGREVVVSAAGKEMTPKDSNTRTRAHGYGGGAAAAGHGKLVLSDFASNSVLEVHPDGSRPPKRIVPDNTKAYYADFDMHPTKPNLVVAIREDVTNPDAAKQVTTLVLIDSEKASVTALAEGKDFYSAPRWDNEGGKLCWLEWSHPNMPWDSVSLYIADFDPSGRLVDKQLVAGGHDAGTSISQPRWALDGKTLLFLSDATGYYNPYAWSPGHAARPILPSPLGRDCGAADWWFAMSSYTPVDADTILLPTATNELSLVKISTGATTPIKLPTAASYTFLRAVSAHSVMAIAVPVSAPASVITFDPFASAIVFKTLKHSVNVELDGGYISVPRQITFPVQYSDRPDITEHSYAWYYEPVNKDYRASAGDKPPLVIRIHGGPTQVCPSALDLRWQYWTSRGFALADVAYGGTFGHGRAFRNRLQGRWGIVDVDDAVAAARYFIDRGLADAKRVLITGQSAGGYTTLQAACSYPDFFAAGISLYGVGDLFKLVEESHKFELRYIDGLIGGSPQEIPQVWHERSPVFHVKKIKTPMLLLQGDQDTIVTAIQAHELHKAMQSVGVRCEVKIYQGAGHGFKKGSTISDSAERAYGFAIDVLGIKA